MYGMSLQCKNLLVYPFTLIAVILFHGMSIPVNDHLYISRSVMSHIVPVLFTYDLSCLLSMYLY